MFEHLCLEMPVRGCDSLNTNTLWPKEKRWGTDNRLKALETAHLTSDRKVSHHHTLKRGKKHTNLTAGSWLQTPLILLNKGNGKVVPVLSFLPEHHAMKAYWRSGGIAPRSLDLGTGCRWVVSFIPWPLHPQRKSPYYPLDRSLGGPQSRWGRGGEEKNSCPPPRIEP
jgi:hypothetical protein